MSGRVVQWELTADRMTWVNMNEHDSRSARNNIH